MHTTYMHSKPSREFLHLDRQTWLILSGLAGALFACLSPVGF